MSRLLPKSGLLRFGLWTALLAGNCAALLVSWSLWAGPESSHSELESQTWHKPAEDPTPSLQPVSPAASETPEPGAEVIRIPSYSLPIDLGAVEPTEPGGTIRLCQAKAPAAPRCIYGVDCQNCDPCREAKWSAWRPIPWEVFAQGEYIGPHRTTHVDSYRLRVDDEMEFVYRLTREISPEAYRLNVGDSVRVESAVRIEGRDEKEVDREVIIQPDGTITLPNLNQVRAAGRTVEELREHLEERYKKFLRVPAITVTPIRVNTRLEDLRAAVDARAGNGGQLQVARVTPEGTVQLPGIGSVFVQGLTLDELKLEINERYAQSIGGVDVQPRLTLEAPGFVYVLGEVVRPDRYQVDDPITVMGAIAMAGGWLNGGNLRQVVVFRRAEDWRLMATKLDLRGALLGKRPCPADEIWLRDGDIVVIPKMPIVLVDEFIELVFTRGLYGIIPVSGVSVNYSRASSL